jgi:hypothetical protein
VSQGFRWGFGKTLPLWFGFGGAISTLARQRRRIHLGSSLELHLCGSTSTWSIAVWW